MKSGVPYFGCRNLRPDVLDSLKEGLSQQKSTLIAQTAVVPGPRTLSPDKLNNAVEVERQLDRQGIKAGLDVRVLTADLTNRPKSWLGKLVSNHYQARRPE